MSAHDSMYQVFLLTPPPLWNAWEETSPMAAHYNSMGHSEADISVLVRVRKKKIILVKMRENR